MQVFRKRLKYLRQWEMLDSSALDKQGCSRGHMQGVGSQCPTVAIVVAISRADVVVSVVVSCTQLLSQAGASISAQGKNILVSINTQIRLTRGLTVAASDIVVAIAVAVEASKVVVSVAVAVQGTKVVVSVAVAIEATPTPRSDCQMSRQLTEEA